MRYPAVLLCFALVISTGACAFDDGDDPLDDSATAESGKDLVVDIGAAHLKISQFAIGTGPGQLEPGSEVSLDVRETTISGRKSYSPEIRINVRGPDGASVSGLNLSPPAEFEISYDANGAKNDGLTGTLDVELVQIDGSTVNNLTFTTAATPTVDANYITPFPGRARTQVTTLTGMMIAESESAGGALPSPTALTGTTSTVLSSTVFQLSDTASAFDVSLAIPTTDTTAPPAVFTLNDASFDAGNPASPTNRLLTVQTGGVTYTTDDGGASVVAQLDTFSGGTSSGSMSGTMIEQGGGQALTINFTFTTGSAPTVALGGTVTESSGRRTIYLQDETGQEQVAIVLPDTLPNGTLDPITFDDSSFDSSNPTDPNGRVMIVTDNGEIFSSDVAVVGDVTLTFTSWDNGTMVGQGTITGDVASPTPNAKSLNYTFDAIAGGAGGGGTLSAGTPVDVTTTDQGDESAVVFNGTDYVAIWLSDVGTTNRTLELQSLNPDTLAAGTLRSFEPTIGDFDPSAGFSADVDASGNIMIVGATGTDDTTDSVVGVLYDYAGGSLISEFSVATGTNPRVVYNAQSNNFVIAHESSGNVDVRAYDATGTAIAGGLTAITGARLAGLASAGGANDEALVTGDGGGIVGQLVTPGTGVLSGGNFSLSTSLSGGLCIWDQIGAQYVIQLQTLFQTVFTAQTAVALAPGTSAPVGSEFTLGAAAASVQGTSGNAGAILFGPGANLYPLDSDAGGPTFIANTIVGATIGLNVDTTGNGPALAAAGSNRYVIVAARGAGGVTAIPLTLTP